MYMNEIEKKAQHEVIKKILKQAIDNNPYLTPYQKEIQKVRIDEAAAQADQFMDLLAVIGYIGL